MMLTQSSPEIFAPLRRKLKYLGFHDENQVSEILSWIRVGPRLDRGLDILPAGCSSKHSTVLIEGVACLYERLANGSRQIYAFQYSGDLCDLNRRVLLPTDSDVSVGAVTECLVGFLDNGVLEEMLVQYPAFAQALWRSSALEAGALRARLLGFRKPAVLRVAHLLCAQLARLAVIGTVTSIIPVSQIELADAAGLSIVHVNRTFKEMQAMGLVTKAGRSMKVVDRQGLARLANFDGRYLNLPELLAGWDVKVAQA